MEENEEIEEYKLNIKNEVLNSENKLPKKIPYNLFKSTVKIEIDDDQKKASGFFIKFKRNDKDFYCLMTNEHVLTQDMVENQKEIEIKYDNESKSFPIVLNQKERIIICFNYLNIDLTSVEIIKKDNINNEYFLKPNYDYGDGYEQFKKKNIEISQYPDGKYLSLSHGKIIAFLKGKFQFIHDASTMSGSSGSPIVLEGEERVLGIHRGGDKDKNLNCGYFIGPAIEIIKQYKRNGKGIEYYEDGRIKYEGEFVDDEYDDNNGTFYYENGDIYNGQFKNGKKNGDGCIFDKNNNLKKIGKFIDDEFIEEEESDKKNDDNNCDDDNFDEDNNDDNNNDKNNSEKNNDDENNYDDNKNDDNKNDDNNNDDNNNDNNNSDKSNEDNKDYDNNDENGDSDNDDINENNDGNNNDNNSDQNIDENLIKNNNNNNNICNNYNNSNNNNNISNNNNSNNQQNHINIFDIAKTAAYHIFSPIGNYVDILCNECHHLTKEHCETGFGSWKCNNCGNVCSTLNK